MNDNLVRRVEQVEKRNRFLLGFVIVLLLVVTALLFYDFSKGRRLWVPGNLVVDSIKVDTLSAKSVQVVSSLGKNSITLGATEDGWTILAFRGLDGVQKAALAVTPSGKPSLDLFTDKAPRLSLGVVDSPTGEGEEISLHLRDKDNKVIWHPDVVNPY